MVQEIVPFTNKKVKHGGDKMKFEKHTVQLPLYWPRLKGNRRNLVHWLLPTPGNVLFTLLVVGGLLWASNAGALLLRAPALAGDSTTTISYQGRLVDSSGNPVDSPGIGMQFCLYDRDTGGAPLDDWCENHTSVPVEDGLFHVLLGNIKPIPVSILASHSTLWLGITVDGDSEMTPREQIASVPYAMIASTVPDGSIATEKIADGAVTTAKLSVTDGLTMTGELAVAGAFQASDDSDAYIQFNGYSPSHDGNYDVVLKGGPDAVRIYRGNSPLASFGEGGQSVVFRPFNQNDGFYWYTYDDRDAMFIHATSGNVGIGTVLPESN